MIIDDLPSISIANDSDEIAIEQGTATKKITKANLLKEINSDVDDLETIVGSGQLSGFTATDLTGAANELKSNLNSVETDVSDIQASLPSAFMLQTDQLIPAGSDLNNYTTPGTYRVASDSISTQIANIPRAASGMLVVLRRNGTYLSQIYIPSTTVTIIYIRNNNNGSWAQWFTLFSSAIETLTCTRIENNLQSLTDFSRIIAYKKNGTYFVAFNAKFNSGQTTSDFTEIGRISNWNAAQSLLQAIPAQSTTHSVLTLRITGDGIMSVFFPSTSIGDFYRASLSVPEV